MRSTRTAPLSLCNFKFVSQWGGEIKRVCGEIVRCFYLFGWKKDFSRARRVARACRSWESHDAKPCALARSATPLVISEQIGREKSRALAKYADCSLGLVVCGGEEVNNKRRRCLEAFLQLQLCSAARRRPSACSSTEISGCVLLRGDRGVCGRSLSYLIEEPRLFLARL